MKYLFPLAVLCAFLVTWGARVESGNALHVVELNTGAFLCDGTRHELIADLPENVRVRKIVVWIGAYDFVNADIIYSVEKISGDEWESIAKGGYDHYVRGGGLDAQLTHYDFAPDWIEISKGETLALEAQCNAMDKETKTKKAHEIVQVYFTP